MFERKASVEEVEANVNTIGNVDQYITHELKKVTEESPDCRDDKNNEWTDEPGDVTQMTKNLKFEAKAAKRFFNQYRDGWGNVALTDDKTPANNGWERSLCGRMMLKHLVHSVHSSSPNTPIWNIRVDGAIMSSHTDIDSKFVTSFVRQLYSDALIPNSSLESLDQPSSQGGDSQSFVQ